MWATRRPDDRVGGGAVIRFADGAGSPAPVENGRGWTRAASRPAAPLVDLLGEIRGLRNLRHRGEISGDEYERRRRQVLERF